MMLFSLVLIFMITLLCIVVICRNHFVSWNEDDQMLKNLLDSQNDFSLYTEQELVELKEKLIRYMAKIDFISSVDYELTQALINQVEIEIELRKIK